jgi:hypothetical protein
MNIAWTKPSNPNLWIFGISTMPFMSNNRSFAIHFGRWVLVFHPDKEPSCEES